MKLTFKSVPNAENIRSWAEAIPGKLYIGYNRLYFRNGWNSRWFMADGNTCPAGNICEGLTEEEVSFLNRIHDWLEKKWKAGCNWKMVEDLNSMDCRVGDHLYLLQVDGGPCGCLIHFNTAYGNGDYPVRVYLYREERKTE